MAVALILALLAIKCSVVATAEDPLHLDVHCAECSSTHGYAYPREKVHAEMWCDDCHSRDWACFDASGKPSNFTYLEAFQLVVEDESVSSVAIRFGLREDAGMPREYSLFTRLFKDDFNKEAVGPFPWGSELIVPVSMNAPAHLTLLPTTAEGSVDETRAYAIFISVRQPPISPAAGVQIRIHGDLTWESARSQSTWSIASFQTSGCSAPFTRPMWQWSDGQLGYFGTLSNLGTCGDQDVDVVLDDGVSSFLPLSTSSATLSGAGIRAVNTSEQAALDLFLRDGLVGARSWSDVPGGALDALVTWSGVPIKAAQFAQKLRVRGYGRISGLHLAARYGPKDMKLSLLPKPARLRDVLERIEYSVLVGLLDLASSYPTESAEDPAVDVSGISVVNAPRRNKGAIEINSAYIQMEDGDNNQAARLFDLKTPGTWLQASDGPEVMGRGSNLQHLYLHHADDSLKMAVSGWHASNVTVLQGNVGSVVNVGSYGFTRGQVQNVSAVGIYVHRLTQTDASWDGYGGLIATHNRLTGNNITGVTISGLSVPNLGGLAHSSGTRGPNCIYRLFAWGFFSDSSTPRATSISQISWHSSDVRLAPLAPSLLYETCLGCDPAIAWGSMHAVSFLHAPGPGDFNYDNYLETALKVYPRPDSSYFYCVNADPSHSARGVDSEVISGHGTQPLEANVVYQTRYGNDTMVEWDVQYPVSLNVTTMGRHGAMSV